MPNRSNSKRYKANLIPAIEGAGGNREDIIAIYINKNGDTYYANVGDWASRETTDAIREILGSVEIEAESPPSENDGLWDLIWPESKTANQGRDLSARRKNTKGNDTAMVAFFLPPDVAERLALAGGEPAKELHLTLAFLGDADQITDIERLKDQLALWSRNQIPITGRINGLGRFTETGKPGQHAIYASFDAPALPRFRQALCGELEWLGLPPRQDHGYTPHITLTYTGEGDPSPTESIEPVEITFTHFTLVIGDSLFHFELNGTVTESIKSADQIIRGGAVKALGDGRVGGYLILWGNPKNTDLEGDYFTPDSDLGWAGNERRLALYDHGLDETIGRREIGNRLALKRIDNVGAWVETQLNMRDEWEAAMYGLVQQKKLGWSSGTASHLVIRESDGFLRRWHVVEGSLTPHPAEPRTQVVPLKSYQPISIKSLCESGQPTEPPGAAGAGQKRSAKSRKRTGEIKMNMTEQLLEGIRQLVPNLSEEQIVQITAVLQLYYGAAEGGQAPEVVAEDGGGEGDQYMQSQPMRSAGARRFRNPANAPQQPDLAEEVKVVLKQLGIELPQPSGGPAQQPAPAQQPPARPPYQFSPRTAVGAPAGGEDPNTARLKSISILQFGEVEPAIKQFTREIYGDDYEVKRLMTHQALGKYARYGREALSPYEQKLLKSVLLAPKQIKAWVATGVDMNAIKTEMSEVVDTLGGFLVPEDFRLDMIERLPELSNIRQYADVSPTTSDVMTRVKVTGGNDQYQTPMRVTWVGDTPAENQADTAPTFGVEKTPIHIAKITVPVPMALLEDTAFPLTQKLSEWSANTYAVDENTQFLTGNGIAKPQGILPGSANLNTRLTEVAAGSTSAITNADKIIDLVYAVAQQYWNGCRWTMQRATTGSIRKLKAGDGHYLWRDGLEPGQPPTLLGYPVDLNESAPAIASGAYPILFGNHYEGYQIADRIGMSLLRDEVTQAEQDIVKFLFRRRLGGQLKGEWAYALLKMATS
jgi:HK97 family phage major capsid protein